MHPNAHKDFDRQYDEHFHPKYCSYVPGFREAVHKVIDLMPYEPEISSCGEWGYFLSYSGQIRGDDGDLLATGLDIFLENSGSLSPEETAIIYLSTTTYPDECLAPRTGWHYMFKIKDIPSIVKGFVEMSD